ncbi:GCN5 family acetyltransferase [Bacillaceae bacterium JMAK1]|nr:GCN5 family acetyltransferase [Bacillaceae bacterium JMAK1]
MKISIREEHPSDDKEIECVIEMAFRHAEHTDHQEHKLVAKIRETNAYQPDLTFVAVDNERIVGHIVLSKITIKNDNDHADSLALAPVSVLPVYQGRGIGSQLIQHALSKATELGHQSVIVLGHEAYYPRFGFTRASDWKIVAPFDVPDESFMAIELQPNALQHVHGTVHYSRAFNE